MKELHQFELENVSGSGVIRDVGGMVGAKLGGLTGGLLGYGFG